MVLEWAFCDQAPGVWCVQHAPDLEADRATDRGASESVIWLYGVKVDFYGWYVQSSLFTAKTPSEIASLAWMACGETSGERSTREMALDQGPSSWCNLGVCRWFGERRRSRILNLRSAPFETGADSEVGCWFADRERSWHRLWAHSRSGPLVSDTYETSDGKLGYQTQALPSMNDWTNATWVDR